MSEGLKVRAKCYLPADGEVLEFGSKGIEAFHQIEDYWMKRSGLLFYPFDRNNQAYFLPSDRSEQEAESFQWVENDLLDQREYETSILMAKEEMAAGNFEKVVLARNEIIKRNCEPDEVFERAMETYSSSYCYLIDLGYEQWVGASPELLMHFEGNTLYTVALAGTKLLNETFTEKEQKEQQLVEEFIEQKLSLLGLNNFHKSTKQEAVFNQIKHLKTSYTVQCQPEQAMEVLKHLQPTSAVCGLPRDTSFAFISEFETLNRGFYSGITGVLNEGSATFFVNLRCMRFTADQIELFAGAGITSASHAEEEWLETERKLQTIKELL